MTDTFEMKRRTLLQLGSAAGGAAALGLGIPSNARAAATERVIERGGIGAGLSRAEGALKVTGAAPYAIEQALDRMAYGVAVQSTVPAGRIRTIDTAAAEAAPGVIAVYTPSNAPEIFPATPFMQGGGATEAFTPLQDDVVRYNGMHLAFVVAETFEEATEAAHLVTVDYEAEPFILNITDPKAAPQHVEAVDAIWGDADAAMETADVTVDAVYTTSRNYNSPMEPHACIASWADDLMTVWEPSQWVGGARNVISQWMGLPLEQVRVLSPYVGGAFGSKIAPHAHVAMACAASRALQRPVKCSLTRQQTFTGLGGRPASRQTLKIGATAEGKIVSVIQEGFNESAIDDFYIEPANTVTRLMYAVPNIRAHHSIVPIHATQPGWMRAPLETPSTFGLETAMDELSYKLGIDPVELRLRNWAEQDPSDNIPWSTRQLREAYTEGARAFGWANRTPEPRSMREGRELIGYGMAAGTYPILRTDAEAKVVIFADGSAEVHSAGVDIGTGTYTILAQTAADILGIPSSRIKVVLGDTDLPRAPLAGGSQLANNLTSAVDATARSARTALLQLAASDPASPLRGDAGQLALEDGMIRPTRRPSGGVAIGDLLRAVGRDRFETTGGTFAPDATEETRNAAAGTFTTMRMHTFGGVSMHSWIAQFVEVRVDEDFGTIRVKRMVAAVDSGRIYNPKLAESQWKGGMVMGIGQALLEEGVIDPRDGRTLNANFADYVMPVNADVPEITTISVGIPDLHASALGGKAVGEIGICGVGPAIGNAVYHATGKRLRHLPITMESLA